MGAGGIQQKNGMRALVTVTAGVAISANAMKLISWTSVLEDGGGFCKDAAPFSKLYAPVDGQYLVCAQYQTVTATAHDGIIRLNYNGAQIKLERDRFPAGSSTYPNMNNIMAVQDCKAGDYFELYVGATAAITTGSGEFGLSMTILKVG